MDKRYAAFLSYSHTDAAMSIAVRDALQQLAKPWHKPRALRIFRDNSSLSATEALWPSIQAAMDTSRYFILLASPHAATSPWVAREVTHWLAHNPPGTLLIAVTSGELHWNPTTGDYDPTRTNCLPPPLYGRGGNEPRWVDLRDLPPNQLTLRNTTFRDRIADLAAPLHGINKDDLVGTDIRQHQRTQRLIRATIAGLATLLVVAGAGAVVAVNRTRAAVEQRLVAQEQQALADQQRALAEERSRDALARQLLAEADLLLESTGRLDTPEAARLGLAALHLRDDDYTRARLLRYTTASDIRATLFGHTDSVRSLAYSPDGTVLASAGQDQTVRMWDVRDADRPHPLGAPVEAHTDSIVDLTFSPDGSLLATASLDGQVILWDAGDPAAPTPIRDPLVSHADGASVAVFAPEAASPRLLATAGLDGQVILWDVTDPAAPRQIGKPLSHEHQVWTAAFSPDGSLLAVAGQSETLYIYDVSDPAVPTPVARFRSADTVGIRSVAFHPDGNLVATGGFGEGVELWDVRNPDATKPAVSNLFIHTPVYALAFTPSGKYLAVGGAMEWIEYFEIKIYPDAMYLLEFDVRPEAFDRAVTRLAFSPDGRSLAAGSSGGAVTLRITEADPFPNLAGPVLAGNLPALSPDGRTLAAIDPFGNTVTLWDVTDPGQPIRLGGPHEITGFLQRHAAFSPDGRRLAIADENRVRLWDVSDPSAVEQVGHALIAGTDAAISFSPDGRYLATASEDEGLALWDIADPDNPDGVRVSDAGEPVRTVAFSPDGRLLAMGSGYSRALLWDVSDPENPEKLGTGITAHTDAVTAVGFTTDGSMLATGDASGTVVLWDVTDPSHPRPLSRPPAKLFSAVTALSFSPDGRSLMASTTLKFAIWEISYPSRPARLGLWDDNEAFAFAPVGQLLLINPTDEDWIGLKDFSRFDDVRANLTDYACALAGRGLDPQEWEVWLPSIPYHDTCPADR